MVNYIADADGEMFPETDWVDPNEGAIMLSELNRPGPLYKGFHRYLLIKVIRNDHPEMYREDLGLAVNFVGGQFNWPGGVWNKKTKKGFMWDYVGRMRGESEALRYRTPEETEKLLSEQGYEYTEGTPAEWEEEYLKEADRQKMAASKKSVNGTHFSITR